MSSAQAAVSQPLIQYMGDPWRPTDDLSGKLGIDLPPNSIQHEHGHSRRDEPLSPFKYILGDRVDVSLTFSVLHLKEKSERQRPVYLMPVLRFACLFDLGMLMFPVRRTIYVPSPDCFAPRERIAFPTGETIPDELYLGKTVEYFKKGKVVLVALGQTTSYLRLECTDKKNACTFSAIFYTDHDWVVRETEATRKWKHETL